MTVQSKSVGIKAFITGVVWFVCGVVVTIVLYPSLTTEYPSEMVFVNVDNQSQSKCWVLIEDSKGNTQGQIVNIQESASIQVFAGEFYEDRFPERVQITVLSGDYLVLDTRTLSTTIKTVDDELAQIIDLIIVHDESGQLAVIYLATP